MMMKHALILLLLATPLSLLSSACGSSESPADLTSAAQKALNSGDDAGALAKFRRALEGLKPGDDGYLEAKLGAIQARIASDAEGAKDEFLELATAQPDLVDERRYSFIGGHMAGAKEWLPAIALVDAGIKRFGKDGKLNAVLEKIKKESAGDEAATSALAGLGYL